MLTGNTVSLKRLPHVGAVWTKQITQSTKWIMAFLDGHSGEIVRTMSTASHFRRDVRIDITTDACPSGLGAVLSIDGQPVEYFSSQVSTTDVESLGLSLTSDSTNQQALEALAILVSLRLWRYHWASVRCVLHVPTDNMAALQMICKMQSRSPSLGIISREVALDVADAIYEPQLVSHIPGVANVCADALSRRYMPNRVFVVPTILQHATEVQPEPRHDRWWRTLCGPRRSHCG